MHSQKDLLVHVLFFVLQISASIGFVLRHEYPYLFNPLAMSVVYIGMLLWEKYTAFTLHFHLRWMLVILLSSHTVFGEYYRLYERSVYFDKTLHVFGTITCSLIAYSILTTFIEIRSSHPLLTTFLVVTVLGISLGNIFELDEFALDLIFNENNQRGMQDTNLDLLFNLTGSLVAAILVTRKNPFSTL